MNDWKTILKRRTATADVWIGQSTEKTGDSWGDYLAEAFVKVPGGIKHLVYRYREQPTFQQAVADCEKSGYLAKRPYQLGQGCDGSINSCVHALLYRWCHDTGHDAVERRLSRWHDQSLQKRRRRLHRPRVQLPRRTATGFERPASRNAAIRRRRRDRMDRHNKSHLLTMANEAMK